MSCLKYSLRPISRSVVKYSARFISNEIEEKQKLQKRPMRRTNVTQRLSAILSAEYLSANVLPDQRQAIEKLLPPSSNKAPGQENENLISNVLVDNRSTFSRGSIISVTEIIAGRRQENHLKLEPGAKEVFSSETIPHERFIELRDGDVLKIGDTLLLASQVNLDDFLTWRMKPAILYLRDKLARRISEGEISMLHPLLTVELALILEITAGSHVLEVGTGMGGSTIKLSEIVGPQGFIRSLERCSQTADIARTNVAMWRERRGEGKCDPDNASVITGDADDPFCLKTATDSSDGCFDAVLIDIIEPEKIIPHVFQFLKQGGCLGFTTSNLSVVEIVTKLVHEKRIPLFTEMVVTKSDSRWKISDENCRLQNRRINRFPFRADPTWIVKMRKTESFQFVEEAVIGASYFEWTGNSAGEHVPKWKKKINL